MDQKQFEIMLHDVELKIKRLKALYEQWFQGIERMEPLIPRKDLERMLQVMKKEKPRNTAARFRLQQLQARYNTYQTYWQRIGRRIEEGTYERDLRRVRRNRKPVEEKKEVKAFEIDLDEFDTSGDQMAAVLAGLEQESVAPPAPASERPKRASGFSAFSPAGRNKPAAESSAPSPQPVTATFGRPKRATSTPAANPPAPRTPARPASGARPKPPPSPQDGMKHLYDSYVAARQRNNERTDNMSYDKLESSIQKMKSKLRQKHGAAKKIDFEVVVQNGRVGLKPKIG